VSRKWSWSVLRVVVVLKARPSWVKLKSWLIPSSTTPRGYYFHPFPDDRAEGAKYRFSGFTPNKQTNKHHTSFLSTDAIILQYQYIEIWAYVTVLQTFLGLQVCRSLLQGDSTDLLPLPISPHDSALHRVNPFGCNDGPISLCLPLRVAFSR